MVTRRRCADLSPATIQHPLDREAVAVLRNAAGFDDLVRWLFEYGFERWERVVLLASAVRVSERQFPALHQTFLSVCARLGVSPPPLYLASGSFNALTAGVDNPYVVISPGVVTLTESELEFVLGHELGHIKLQHVLHGTVARALPLFASMVPVAGQLLTSGLNLAIQEWKRRAELSCDRYGLLANQDLESAIRLKVKISGVPAALYDQIDTAAYLAQFDELTELQADRLSLVYRVLAELRLSHPWMVVRAKELSRWVESGEYEARLAECELEQAEVAAPPDLAAACRAVAERIPGVLGEAFAALAESSAPRVLFTGGRGRGRSTLIQELLGERVIPARANPVRLLSGPRWTLHGPDGQLLAEDLPFPATPGAVTVRGPAPMLESLELREIPGFDVPEGAADLPAELAAADLVVCCTSATQLLSDAERRWLREELVPRAAGPVALVVTRGGDLDPADRAELQARIDRVLGELDHPAEAGPLPVFWWPDDTGAPGTIPDGAPGPDTLRGWLQAEATRLAPEREGRRKERISRLVALATLRHTGELPADAALEERLRSARGACRSRAADRLAGLRAELRERLERLSAAALPVEGPALVQGEVARLHQELSALFLEEMGAEPLGARLGDTLPRLGQAESTRRRPRDPRAMALAGASVLLVMLAPLTPITAAGAAVGLLGARAFRARQESVLHKEQIEELVESAGTWLDEVEAALPRQLDGWSAEVRRVLREVGSGPGGEANPAEVKRRLDVVVSALEAT